MAIVVLGIISVVASMYIVQVFNSWIFINTQKTMGSSDRLAIYRMVREIRMTNTTANILTFTAGTYSFKDPANNTITYTQTGTNLMRNTDILAGDLVNPGGLTFTYLDSTGAVTAVQSSISVVKVDIIGQRGINKFTIESAGRLRLQ